ncbi:hypothetical protein [Paenibacillus sp. 481]|nr:hypothetical protein [Paenibacillus sp. 481]UHA72729.1 hypothetical protein KIK04_19155 [Paenibacillus sp. 481]
MSCTIYRNQSAYNEYKNEIEENSSVLNDMKIIVTGAASGIGEQLVQA